MFRWLLVASCLAATVPAVAQTYENCGKARTIDRPPQRIVALNQHSADTLLALGVGPTLIGIAYIDDDGAAIEHGAYRGVPVISKLYPSAEVLYAQQADLVVGGFASAFAPHLSSRPVLASQGIASYLMESGCASRSRDFFKHIRHDLTTLGALVQRQAQAQHLIAALDTDLAATQALHGSAKPLSVFYLDSEADGLHSVGKNGFITTLLSTAGARNTFGDVDIARLSISRETLLDSDPDVILLADAVWSPASRKRQLLTRDPVLSQLRAVKQNHLIDIPFAHLVPTLASGRVALELAQRFKQIQAP
ncbi:iron complex transport system substrate-binding protein [Pseudomonas sp. ok272]|uniref:ABC transporter substrate-binding protein n=1 Tax=unclassified Pseudomonas TaxID=196821 RepID=UPI0008D14DA8|nr:MULTISPECIES: ABC transporter substrate-binding protein [unclassified Pseudomonas]SEN58862.1 iron complex transport system substrate-binding protein [Pseudomonas sp. ok272]SFN37595.1 iron complex transport system substrate-binding protein [Pseudomonas sp. ok602]